MIRSSKYKRKDRFSPIDEQFKLIRTGIDYAAIDEKKQVILITSPESGSGKSTVASRLAMAYAQKGEKTLLIDADMRRPVLHKNFAKLAQPGLSNVMLSESILEDSLQKIAVTKDSLMLLTSGAIPPSPNDLLSTKRMSEILTELRAAFDRIIIDTPPVTIVSDALVLAELADGAVLVCRYHKTRKDKAKQAVNQLRLAKASLIGVVFNGVKNAESYYY
ncbi:capsular polysaccharide biosynthesis [Listeria floridensis FSL S10-1187]|uniref:Capsular polysaccharide biosynthesis n=1 Tax=Listeria floridensis FSL S10-1187 TaxID=1265817 RepID=A0ABN0REJ6_9LIST|nr:CpsD/CapB family tyrosine-protein kinase [Listeria floridensis]EUJ31342.1 capsular polysaccharide biosynthesis [Listeria floridensis FSL S10-1187]